MRLPFFAPLVAIVLLVSGCAGRPHTPVWEADWPGGSDLGRAAGTAARSPGTWAPLAAAALLTIGDLDEDISDWGADHTPLFGDDADSDSDDLRTAATAAWLITALAAPSRDLGDKAGGLAVGAATLLLETAVTDGIKETTERARPDGSDHRSFTSGHAGSAAAATTLARRNLDYLSLPPWLDTTLRIGLHGVALGTGWARVEAEKHYVTDILGGYAVGHFLASFMQHAFMQKPFMQKPFMRSALPAARVSYQALPGGGAVTVVFALH